MTKMCSTEGCDREAKVKGMCLKHYAAQWRVMRDQRAGFAKAAVTSPVDPPAPPPPDRLEVIRKRFISASPGPWVRVPIHGHHYPFGVASVPSAHRPCIETPHWPGSKWQEQSELNAEFITHSWEDMKWCLQEIRRLREQLNSNSSPTPS